MTVENLLLFGKENIHSDYAKIILAEILNRNPLELLNYLNDTVTQEQEEIYKKAILAVKKGKPIQYALGKVNFYGISFFINENVLIPRFETEELVENTIKYIQKFFPNPVDIIDLGCGSGVIGLTLEQKVPTNSVDLIDISKEALEVTHKNCAKLHSKAQIKKSDMLESVEKKYDVIISNPPYIKTEEQIEEIGKNNEPHLALYGGEEGLDLYIKILKNVTSHMKERCLIAFEIGATQKEDLEKLVKMYLQEVKIITKKDLSGRDRMMFIFKNCE